MFLIAHVVQYVQSSSFDANTIVQYIMLVCAYNSV
jgi:hypothetical protein